MKNILSKISLIVLLAFALGSCSKDSDPYEEENRINKVTYKISCNNPIAHVYISAVGPHRDVVFIGQWETTFETKDHITGLEIVCRDDKKATVTCELYVNDKLVRQKSDYYSIFMSYKLKY